MTDLRRSIETARDLAGEQVMEPDVDPRGNTARLIHSYAAYPDPGPILHPADHAELAAAFLPVEGAIAAAEFHELQDRPSQKWNLDELDKMHHYAGIGPEWQASARRAELAATIGRRADRLEALAYECHRLVEVPRRARLLQAIR